MQFICFKLISQVILIFQEINQIRLRHLLARTYVILEYNQKFASHEKPLKTMIFALLFARKNIF